MVITLIQGHHAVSCMMPLNICIPVEMLLWIFLHKYCTPVMTSHQKLNNVPFRQE